MSNRHRARPALRWTLAAVLLAVGACESESEADYTDSVRAGLGVGVTGAQMSLPQTVATNLPCYNRADERTTLSRDQALLLCRGADSTAPSRCFEEADDETTLSDGQALKLCRCAKSLRPLRCYQQAEDNTLLEDDHLIEMCRPIRARQLTPNCIPIRTVR